MKLKILLLATISLLPYATFAQSSAPICTNERYNICMSEGYGKGRSYTTPEGYCQQWAGLNQISYTCEVTYEIPIEGGQQATVPTTGACVAQAVQSAGDAMRGILWQQAWYRIMNVECSPS